MTLGANSVAEKAMVRKVMVATDRSSTADSAVRWASDLAMRCEADLLVVQVLVPGPQDEGRESSALITRAHIAEDELTAHARALAGSRGHARVVVGEDPSSELLKVAGDEGVDTLVVGNIGMRDRKRFLLANIPNRISHNAHCNVIIVNTSDGAESPAPLPVLDDFPAGASETQPRLMGRAAEIAAVMARHGIVQLFTGHQAAGDETTQAHRLREALEELGPTFSKLGQILSTRPDLLPAAYIDELAQLQDHVTPLTETQVVEVMEEELGVPWEDVFQSIDPSPLAAGTIAQVHRATLEGGERVVVKVQRPECRNEINADLSLLELFADRTRKRPLFHEIIDMSAVFKYLSESLERELDFRVEASNIRRMSQILEPFSRLDVPEVYEEFSSRRLLVMEEIQGVPVKEAAGEVERREAARQLLESYYQQILTEGFFHADPHPGNLMWWDNKIYFLDFGMVGEVSPDLRRDIMMLLLAFWQEDVGFLMDVTLMLADGTDRSDLDADRFRAELGDLMAKYRNVSLKEIQLGPVLQEMTEIAVRYGVPLPASLTLTAKAMAQMQLTAAELDPDLDPFEVAGSYIMRTVISGVRDKMDPKWLFYEGQKLRIRATRLIEALERLTGARPGHKLEVNFRADRLERTLHRAGRELSLGAAVSSSLLVVARLINGGKAPRSMVIATGVLGGALGVKLLSELSRPSD